MLRRSVLERWRRSVERRLVRAQSDAATASMASYIVAASLFIIASSYLLHFVIEPPGSGPAELEHAELASKAEGALGVLVGSPGYPVEWDASTTDVDALDWLGLVESGTTIRIDPDKFDALARGKLGTQSDANGGVDYAEAKSALGLDDYEFHLRAYPIVDEADADDPYGTADFGDFRVAYVGNYNGAVASDEAEDEIASIAALGLDFDPFPRDENPVGDVFKDESNDLRENLLPLIGAATDQTVINAGSGTKYDFLRVESAVYEDLLTANLSGGSTALALSRDEDDPNTLGYSKNRELRTILGSVVMTDVTQARLSWWEWVDTDRENLTYDCGDYGFVEVSADSGATWVRLTDAADERSTDCSALLPTLTSRLPQLTLRTVDDITTLCAACEDAAEVLIAFHWVADNDNDIGYGWVVDDVTLDAGADGEDGRIFSKTFETPEYDMVIFGSTIENNQLEPNDVTEALRDYVERYGGRIMVTGPTSNVNWLNELFDAGTEGASGGISTPDATHPLLTLPNTLSYQAYAKAEAWIIDDDENLFSAIVADDDENHLLSVSRAGAWGSDEDTAEGAVLLSSFLPYDMGLEEGARFFANGVTYGKYHHLYLEVGPSVPSDGDVASATRTATMNMYREGEASYAEMAFILYVWPGTTHSSESAESTLIAPGKPRDVVATAGDDTTITVTWSAPLSTGSHTPDEFVVYRGNAPGPTTEVARVTWIDALTAYSYTEDAADGLVDGQTYYYEITLENGAGLLTAEGPHSDPGSATPFGLPSAPQNLATTPGVGSVTLDWDEPADAGGGIITGYAVWVSDTGAESTFTLIEEIGSTDSYVHAVADDQTRYYNVSALGSGGWGPALATPVAGSAFLAVGAPALNVSNAVADQLTLTWVAPGDLMGQTLEGYRIWRSDAEGGTYTELAEVAPTELTYLDTALGNGATWWYKVQAFTDAGDGTLSGAEGDTTLDVPDAPTDLVASSALGVYTLSWSAPASDSPILYYNVYKGDTAGSLAFLKVAAVSPTTDIQAGTKYYAVTAVSAIGESAMSNVDS